MKISFDKQELELPLVSIWGGLNQCGKTFTLLRIRGKLKAHQKRAIHEIRMIPESFPCCDVYLTREEGFLGYCLLNGEVKTLVDFLTAYSQIVGLVDNRESQAPQVKLASGELVYLNALGHGLRRILAILSSFLVLRKGDGLLVDGIESGINEKLFKPLIKILLDRAFKEGIYLACTTQSTQFLKDVVSYLNFHPEIQRDDDFSYFNLTRNREGTQTSCYRYPINQLTACLGNGTVLD